MTTPGERPADGTARRHASGRDEETVVNQTAASDVPMDADGDRLPDGAWVQAQRKSVNAAGVGVQFGATIVGFALLGLWADRKFDTSPWLLLAGVLVGFGGGTVSLLKKFK